MNLVQENGAGRRACGVCMWGQGQRLMSGRWMRVQWEDGSDKKPYFGPVTGWPAPLMNRAGWLQASGP